MIKKKFMEQIGKNLNVLLANRNVTKEELIARMLNPMSLGRLERVLKGEVMLSTFDAYDIAHILDCEFTDIVGEITEKIE